MSLEKYSLAHTVHDDVYYLKLSWAQIFKELFIEQQQIKELILRLNTFLKVNEVCETF